MPNWTGILTDDQCLCVRRVLPKRKERGRNPLQRRSVIDAILNANPTGSPWRSRPHESPERHFVETLSRRRKEG
ncbi:MAG: transposase, partial [Planctomycetota bacterium]